VKPLIKEAPAEAEPSRDQTDELATAILSGNLHIDVRRGTLKLMGHPIMLFRFEFLVAIQRQLEGMVGDTAKDVMYRAGELAGLKVLPAMSDHLKNLPPDRGARELVLQRMSNVWATIGVGRATITHFDLLEGRFAFRIEHGSYPEAYGPSRRPVCHLWAGWAAGVAKELFGLIVRCDEVRCRAMGDPACEFLLEPLPFP